MAATSALGVIRGIHTGMDYKEMLVFADCLVVISSGEALGRTLAPQFGVIGVLVYRLGRKSREAASERRRQQSPAQLLAHDPKGIQIPARNIVDARLTSGLFSSKLTLSLVDGTSPWFSWAKRDNQYEQVLRDLRQPLGSKLIDEKKAA